MHASIGCPLFLKWSTLKATAFVLPTKFVHTSLPGYSQFTNNSCTQVANPSFSQICFHQSYSSLKIITCFLIYGSCFWAVIVFLSLIWFKVIMVLVYSKSWVINYWFKFVLLSTQASRDYPNKIWMSIISKLIYCSTIPNWTQIKSHYLQSKLYYNLLVSNRLAY